jgi:hypothetical protein
MGTQDLKGLPDGALLVVDSPPVIYDLEEHRSWEPRLRPVFEAPPGRFRFAITTLAIADVFTGPFKTGDDALARR